MKIISDNNVKSLSPSFLYLSPSLSLPLPSSHSLLHPPLSLFADNRICMGETPIEQSEFCHYNTRGVCGPLAFQVLEGLNISMGNGEENLCVCRFREGKYICGSGI